jgi:ABC-type phosphate transport system substrate-binding protein
VRLRLATVLFAAAFAAALLAPARSGAAGEGFVVVVNQANPLDRYGRADIAKLFLRRALAWPGGVPAAPCDLSGTSPIRKAFSERVHSKPMWVIVAYWHEEIASGRSRPPAVCPSEDAALQAVRENPGGISYVGEGTALGPGLKILTVAP